jgi:CheY-specific phosphatase CheX
MNASADKTTFNDVLAKEISHGVTRTLSDVFGVKPVTGLYSVESADEVKMSSLFDIAGFVELNNQEKHGGHLVVSFPQATIFSILGKFYRKQFTAFEKPVQDGVGELTNMIFGLMKANLGKEGFAFKMALPKVVLGNETPDQLKAAGRNQTLVMTIPYETDAGPFSVTLILYPMASSALTSGKVDRAS